MPAIVLIFSLLLPLFGGFGCKEEFEIIPQNNYLYIHVYDDTSEDDLSLEARALLYSYIRKIKHLKKNFTLELSHMQPIKEYRCGDTYHEIFRIPLTNIKVSSPKSGNSYKDLKEKIYYEIVQLEDKESKSLQDWYRLYNLYFSLGKISKANTIMEKIVELRMKGLE